jgi:hypothetical protein
MEKKLRKYQLVPTKGWKSHPINLDVALRIYSFFTPLVNEGVWDYTDCLDGNDVFRDNNGNCVYIEFYENSDEIHNLAVGINSPDGSGVCFLEETMREIEQEYQLNKIDCYDSIE